VLAELLQHWERHGELLLSEHTHLKVEMRAPLCLASHAILADEHKMVRKTLSDETKSAKMPKGKGSKAFTWGIN